MQKLNECGLSNKDVLWTAGEAAEVVLGETERQLPCSKPVFSQVNFQFLLESRFCGLAGVLLCQ